MLFSTLLVFWLAGAEHRPPSADRKKNKSGRGLRRGRNSLRSFRQDATATQVKPIGIRLK